MTLGFFYLVAVQDQTKSVALVRQLLKMIKEKGMYTQI